MRRLSGALAVAMLLFTCEGSVSGEDERARLRKLHADGVALDGAIDQVESRLVHTHHELSVWRELRDRHRIAVAAAQLNLQAHFDGMVRHHQRQQEKMARLRAKLRLARGGSAAFGGSP